MNSKVFLGTYNKIPIYYHSKLRSGIACTTDRDGTKIYYYLVIVNNLEQAIQAIRTYGRFSFKIKL